MYERFTDRARKVMHLANEEAQRFDHEYIGMEHVLLGLIRDDEGVAGRVLVDRGLTLEAVRTKVRRVLERSKPPENPD